MVIPSIVVKVRRPTEEFNGSDSDFEVVSDSGNDNDSVIENGYERLNEELVDAVVLHTRPTENIEGTDNSDQECSKEKLTEQECTNDHKIIVNLTPKQIIGNDDRRLESRESREKKSLSLVMLPKEMTLVDVAVPSSAETPENFISRSVSTNFADRLNTAIMGRNTISNEILNAPNTKLIDAIQTPILSVRKLSDSAVVGISKELQVIPEPLRKNSMPAVLPSSKLITGLKTDNDALNEIQHDQPKLTISSRWSFYKDVTKNAAVDKIRDE